MKLNKVKKQKNNSREQIVRKVDKKK